MRRRRLRPVERRKQGRFSDDLSASILPGLTLFKDAYCFTGCSHRLSWCASYHRGRLRVVNRPTGRPGGAATALQAYKSDLWRWSPKTLSVVLDRLLHGGTAVKLWTALEDERRPIGIGTILPRGPLIGLLPVTTEIV